MSTNLMSQSSSIAALRKAEKQAADKISEARKRKVKRLKQAKEEAKMEINAFKDEMEQKFKNRDMEETGSKDQFEIYVNDMIKTELEKLELSVQANERQALDKVLEAVLNIQSSLHQNFK